MIGRVRRVFTPGTGRSAIEPSASLAGRVGAVDRHLNNADAAPQPRYRGLTLPKLRLGRVKLVMFSEKCRKSKQGRKRIVNEYWKLKNAESTIQPHLLHFAVCNLHSLILIPISKAKTLHVHQDVANPSKFTRSPATLSRADPPETAFREGEVGGGQREVSIYPRISPQLLDVCLVYCPSCRVGLP